MPKAASSLAKTSCTSAERHRPTADEQIKARRRTPGTFADSRHAVAMASELEELRRALDGMRASVLRKLAGLSDADARRSTVPSGTNLAGLVQHLTYVESLWFKEIVSGRSAQGQAVNAGRPSHLPCHTSIGVSRCLRRQQRHHPSAGEDPVVSGVHAAALEALSHPGGCGADIAFAQGMRQRVGRVWAMASEHVAHPFFHGHGFSMGAGGLVGDGQGVGEGVLRERIRVELPLELQNCGDEACPGVVGHQVADCRRPADALQVAGAVDRMEAGVAQSVRVTDVMQPGSSYQERRALRLNREGKVFGASSDCLAVSKPVRIGVKDVPGQVGRTGLHLRPLKPFVDLAGLLGLQVVRHVATS
jgi:Protein of unknown function (DUF664)